VRDRVFPLRFRQQLACAISNQHSFVTSSCDSETKSCLTGLRVAETKGHEPKSSLGALGSRVRFLVVRRYSWANPGERYPRAVILMLGRVGELLHETTHLGPRSRPPSLGMVREVTLRRD